MLATHSGTCVADVVAAYDNHNRPYGAAKDGVAVTAITVSGEIKPGDAKIFDRLSKKAKPWPLYDHFVVALDSRGGDVREAMAIGRIIRKSEFDTHVFDHARCLSSCVFVLVGGVRRAVHGQDYSLPDTQLSGIGLHRPYDTDTGQNGLSQHDSSYKGLVALVRQYFDEMNIPGKLADDLLAIPPEHVRLLSFEAVHEYGLDGWDPAWADKFASREAVRLNISKTEYFTRKRRAEHECYGAFAISGEPLMACFERILQHR